MEHGLPPPPVYRPRLPANSVSTTVSQDAILRALADGITDPNELAKLAFLKKTTDVYAVLDKLSLRKEYHAALDRAGLSLDFIVGRLKTVIENPDDDVAMKGVATILKTIGLDKADEAAVQGQAWEDAVLASVAAGTDGGADGDNDGPVRYEVEAPAMPDSLRKRKDDDVASGKELYQGK